MKKFLAPAVLVSGGLLAFGAQAQQRSYNHVELGYVAQKIDSGHSDATLRVGDIEPTGGYLAFSADLGYGLYATGALHKGGDELRVQPADAPSINLDVDAQQIDLGLGYRHELNERLDLTAEAGYRNTRLAFENRPLGFKDRIKGDDYRLSLGLRGDLGERVEGWAQASLLDGDIYDSQFVGSVGVLIKFNRLWGLTLQAEGGAGTQQYSIGARASF